MRPRMRHEILSFSVVIALPLAVAAVFPYEAVSFKARKTPGAAEARAAFVTLTEEGEAAALKASRASWSVSAGDSRVTELQIEDLPERPISAVLDFDDRSPPERLKSVLFELPAYEPSVAAPRPAKMEPSDAPAGKPAFSRDELLRL